MALPLGAELPAAEAVQVQVDGQSYEVQPDEVEVHVEAHAGLAIAAEGKRGHTAAMHSKHLDRLSRMAREVNTSIFVKNGPALAGLGMNGEGYVSFSIASPTGEGLTSAKDFCRVRRCTLVDSFRIV